MKYFYYFSIIIPLLFCSCSTLPSINSILQTNKETIPMELQEQIVTKINPESEIYAVGHFSLEKTGTLLAQAQSNKMAKDILKNKLKKEITINFNSYLLEIDEYTKNIIKPSLNELIDYSTDFTLNKSVQKGAWENNKEVYSLFSITREEVNSISKDIFIKHLDEITNKISNIKNSL